jgi:hypothetical protein
MPLAVLFIGGVLPVVLGPLIKERNWLYEIQFRMILKIILKKERVKRQAPSCKQRLTMDPGDDRMNLESEKYIMTKKTLKKEYQPGGSERHVILDKAVQYLKDPRFGLQGDKHSFLTSEMGLSESEYLTCLNSAAGGDYWQ